MDALITFILQRLKAWAAGGGAALGPLLIAMGVPQEVAIPLATTIVAVVVWAVPNLRLD